MSQKDLIILYYQACLTQDLKEQQRLFEISMQKIFKKKQKGKKVFKTKYTVMRG
jgi:hypothetical protein